MNNAEKKRIAFEWLRASLIGLIALRFSGIWVLDPPASPSSAIGLTSILVLFVWPILMQQIRPALWLSFVSSLFFIVGVLNAMTTNREFFGIVESVLAATVFISAMLFSRYASRVLTEA